MIVYASQTHIHYVILSAIVIPEFHAPIHRSVTYGKLYLYPIKWHVTSIKRYPEVESVVRRRGDLSADVILRPPIIGGVSDEHGAAPFLSLYPDVTYDTAVGSIDV